MLCDKSVRVGGARMLKKGARVEKYKKRGKRKEEEEEKEEKRGGVPLLQQDL